MISYFIITVKNVMLFLRIIMSYGGEQVMHFLLH